VYRYSLSACFTGTGRINATIKITLNSKNSSAEGVIASGPYLYVLNNGTTKNFYRYPKAGGTAVVSRSMVNTGGTALSATNGCLLDGSVVHVVDAGIDRTLHYSLTSLFTGTGSLSATTAYVLQSTNLNSTGIALSTGILLRDQEDEIAGDMTSIQWIAYPNPTSGIVTLKPEGSIMQDQTIQVFDMAGRLIRTLLVPASSQSTNELMIDLTQEGSGLYLISVMDGTNRSTIRIVVE
jgi:hypothetical protein